MRKYETMIILKDGLDEEARKALIASLLDVLKNNGAKVGSVDEWGSREFAYEINFQKRGYYLVVEYETDNVELNAEFVRVCDINQNVVRNIIVAKPQ